MWEGSADPFQLTLKKLELSVLHQILGSLSRIHCTRNTPYGLIIQPIAANLRRLSAILQRRYSIFFRRLAKAVTVDRLFVFLSASLILRCVVINIGASSAAPADVCHAP